MLPTDPGAAKIRKLGWILVGCGVVIIALMGTITVIVSRVPREGAEGASGASTTFAGTPADERLMYTIFGLVMAVGVVSLAGGVWQVKTGKRSRAVMLLVIALIVALVFEARKLT